MICKCVAREPLGNNCRHTGTTVVVTKLTWTERYNNHFCIPYCSVRQGSSDQYHPTERVCLCVCVYEACVALLSADRHIGHVNSSDSLKAGTILGGQLSGVQMYAQTLMTSWLPFLYPENCHTTAKDGKYNVWINFHLHDSLVRSFASINI